MKLSAILAPLLDQKADHETIRAVILAYESERADALERRRESDRDRQARLRKSRESRDSHVSHSDRALVREGARVEDKPLPTEIEPQENQEKRAQSALRSEFDDQFWPAYPNKVGKPKALAAFVTARKQFTLDAILTGLARYVAGKPADRAWLNPATFLNQERFNDQPAVVVPMARAGPGQGSAAPSLAQVFRMVGEKAAEHGQERTGGSGFREAVLDLSVSRSQ